MEENTRDWNSRIDNSVKNEENALKKSSSAYPEKDDNNFYQFFYVEILTKLADVSELKFYNQEQFVDLNEINRHLKIKLT